MPQLPEMGDNAGVLVSRAEEAALGREFMRQVRRSLKLVSDPEIDAYIRDLGQRLAAPASSRHPFTFFVVEDNAINAFAGPAGHIGIHSGLILAARSEGELASVMAHEIAHVSQRHLTRAFAKANQMQLPMTAAIIAAILLGGADPEAGQAALAATMAGSRQAQLNFTRAHEEEADRVGLSLLAKAGFDPRAMPAFFERLQQATRYYDNRLPELLSTHPVTTGRIADTRSRAEQYSEGGRMDSLTFRLVQAKLRVLNADEPQAQIDRFESRLEESGEYPAADRYGRALALMASGHPDKAADALSELRQQDPERIAYRLAHADALAQAGQADKALDLFQQTLQLYPRNYPVTAMYAQALLRHGKPDHARRMLQDGLRYDDSAPLLYNLLAQAQGQIGNPVAAHQALAEYDYRQGRLHSAIGHLQQALKLIEDKTQQAYQVGRIEARLETLKRESKTRPEG